MNLCTFLKAKRSEIIDDWVSQLSRTVSDRYRKRNLSELRETVSRAYDGNYSVICNHDWQPIEEFIVFITQMRLERGFSLSEVQKAFGIFRIIMISRLPLVLQGEDLRNALLSVNNSVDVTINRFSEYFQSKHEEEMQGLLESLEEKVGKRTEQLYNSENRYRTLVEDISDGYFVCHDERLIFANRALGRMLGQEPEMLLGESYGSLFAGADGQLASAANHEVFESEAIKVDGSRFPVEIKINRVSYDGLPALAGVCRDIVERMASARKELEHERLVVIGRIATIFAHEIRNSLSSIKVNVRILQRKLELAENDTRRMEIILRDIDKLDKILQDTLLFSRPLEISPHWYDVNDLISKAVRRFEDLLSAAGILMQVELDGEVPDLKVDNNSMDIVFDNLITNAIEALHESSDKRLTISTRFRQNAGGNNGLVEIILSDSGCGMRKDELEQIFQPFYTTRKNGIGLGLSNVARVIEQHGGTIGVESRINQGTIFTVALPWQKELK
jgi:PAS domain S-box-containing protein